VSFTVGTVMQNRSVPPTEIATMLQRIKMAAISSMFGFILEEVFGDILRIIGGESMRMYTHSYTLEGPRSFDGYLY
jgi:hypothetical protein